LDGAEVVAVEVELDDASDFVLDESDEEDEEDESDEDDDDESVDEVDDDFDLPPPRLSVL
jgi:hypothetical protein